MGLVERRAAKEFETKQFPQLKKEVDAAAGFEVLLEVRWDTLATEGQAGLYAESWPAIYFEPLITAIRAVGIDDMGREALKAGLKKVVIQNQAGVYYGDRMATFADGVLTLDHEPCTNVADVKDRSKGIQEALEKGL